MNAKISVFVICVEAIIYWLLYHLHDCTFKTTYHYQHITAAGKVFCCPEIFLQIFVVLSWACLLF